MKQLGDTIVSNAAGAIDWSKQRLNKINTGTAQLINAGTKKMLFAGNEVVEISRKIGNVQEIREIAAKNVKDSVVFVLNAREAYDEFQVRQACAAAMNEIDAAIKQINYVDNMFCNMEESLMLAARAIVQADIQTAVSLRGTDLLTYFISREPS